MFTNKKANMMKYLLKNALIIGFIILLAAISTRSIYYKFRNERNREYSSDILEIIFHSKAGNNIDLINPTPTTDAVGLSSKAYTFTITNNLTVPVKYSIKLVDNEEEIEKDNCIEQQVPKQLLKVSIKDSTKSTEEYLLADLVDNVLYIDEIEALGQKDYSIRVWVTSDDTINISNNLHYHGQIKVVEDEE